MKKLIHKSGRQFYTSTVNQIVGQVPSISKCAFVIDEENLAELEKCSEKKLEQWFGQLLVISENADKAVFNLKNETALIIAVESIEEAVQLLTIDTILSKEIVCLLDKEEQELIKIIDNILT